VTEQAAAELARLRIGRGPWHLDEGRPPWARPRSSFRTGVIVVGAGITGSLVAQRLAAEGREVTIIDRLAPSQGSTAASTAMLQWEIDNSVVELAEKYDFATATRVYRQSFAAVQGLGALAASVGAPCHWRPRPALYLAGEGDDGAQVRAEFAARTQAGLPGEWLERTRLRDTFGIDRAAAIVSPGAAECDPVCLAHAMLFDALRHDARLIHEEVVAYDFDTRGARVALAGGLEIEGEALVLATGYAMPPFVTAPVHKLSASWAAVTPAGTPLGFWRDRALVWEDATPYLYMRTTSEDRILVGGEDEVMDDPDERNRMAPQKAAAMHAKLQRLWGMPLPAFESVWSAAFGETDDGMPLIGPVPGCPNAYAAYGYGGNGITYSFLASCMLGELIAGRGEAWFESFALDRPKPAAIGA
jgi:glycine/D-amino acid oxidase-like deaminating enzyme